MENVLISNICIYDTNRGFAVFAGDGGYVKNVSIINVVMDTHIFAGDWWGKGEPFVICSANSNGIIENIRISELTADSENIGLIAGNVRGVTIHDSHINIVDSSNRRYAAEYDIAPNGTLAVKNHFVGKYYTDNGITVCE